MWFAMLLLGAIIGGLAVAAYDSRLWRLTHEAVRADLSALRAAQRISLAAWQAGSDLQESTSRSAPPVVR